MKTMKPVASFSLAILLAGPFMGCVEELPNVSGRNHIYELQPLTSEGIGGHILIRERNDQSTQLELSLNGIRQDAVHPAYIHFGNALNGGGIAITLNPVDGGSPNSVTELTTLDSGLPITYEELLAFDGHLNVQLSDNPGTIAAQADIGQNALTGRFQQFTLQEGDIPDVSGLLTIEERESGFSLLTVVIDGTTEGSQHPATLNFGSIEGQSSVAVTLNVVDGTTGLGKTHLEELDGSLQISYSALVDFQGFIRVHLGTGNDMGTTLAHGNIAYQGN